MNFNKTLIISILVSLFLSFLISATSAYISLRLSALPWPILLSAILSFAFLLVFKIKNIHYINIAHAGASVGGIISSAICFTIPALYFIDKDISLFNPFKLAFLSIFASLFALSIVIKNHEQIINDKKSKLVSGVAAAKTLKILTGKNGKKVLFLFLDFFLIFSFLVFFRDFFLINNFGSVVLNIAFLLEDKIPLFVFSFLSLIGLNLYISPMAIGTGYLLGKDISLKSFFSGAFLSFFIFVPIFVFIFGFEAQVATSIVSKVGMGIIFGSTFIFIVSNIKKIFISISKNTILLGIICVFLLHFLYGLHLFLAFLCVILTYFICIGAMRITAQTDINPYEQFGIYVSLLISAFATILLIPYVEVIYVVFFTTLSAAIASDTLFDLKTAKILKTPKDKVILCDFISCIFSSIFASFIVYQILSMFMPILFTLEMVALQSQIVYNTAFLGSFDLVLIFSMILGGFLYVYAPKWFSVQAFGIGAFIGFFLAIPFAIGGLIDHFFKKKNHKNKLELISISAIASEGLIDFIIFLLISLGYDFVFVGALVLLLIIYRFFKIKA